MVAAKQMVLGEFSEEQNVLGTGGQVLVGFTGLDTAADIRDIAAAAAQVRANPDDPVAKRKLAIYIAAAGIPFVSGPLLTKMLAKAAAEGAEQALETGARKADDALSSGVAAPKSVNPGKLTFDPATKSWTSNGGLVYEQGSAQGNRVLHVLDHLSPNPAKPLHTLFNVDRTQLVGLIDEAWAARQGAGVLQANGNRVFDVAMGRAVGAGGETTIRIVVRDGTTKVITAYPVP